jgi:tetratricopeptide (TPR) repeat protein
MQRSAVQRIVPFLAAALLAGCAAPRAPGPVTGTAVQPAAAPGAAQQPMPPVAQSVPPPTEGDRLYNLLLADIAAQRGDHATAVAYYTAAAREARDARLAQRAARAALFAQDIEAAIAAAEAWRELVPTDPDPYQLLAMLYLQQGHLDAARENLRELLSRGDFSSSADYINLARLFNRDGARESLLAMMDEVLAARPQDPEAMYAYVVVAVRLEAFEKAGEVAERLVAARPDWPDGALAGAQVLELRGERERAASELARFLARHPDAHDVRLARARLLVEMKDYAAAREEFARLTRAHPDDADARLALALVDMQLQDNTAARAHLRALAALPGQAERAHFYLARLAESERDFPAAIAAYAKVRGGEHRLEAVIRQAELLGEQGHTEAARALLHGESTEDQPTHIRLLLTETNLLLDAGHPAHAEKVVNAGLAQYPDDIDLLFARSLVLDKLNRLGAMEKDLRRILAIDPDNAHALNAWGYTLAERGLRLEEAHKLISRALELAPENPYILDSMGWVLHRMGRSEEGLVYLRRSLDALPDPEVYAHIGEVLRVLGRTEEARATIAKGLETSPDDRRLLGVQRQLPP